MSQNLDQEEGKKVCSECGGAHDVEFVATIAQECVDTMSNLLDYVLDHASLNAKEKIVVYAILVDRILGPVKELDPVLRAMLRKKHFED